MTNHEKFTSKLKKSVEKRTSAYKVTFSRLSILTPLSDQNRISAFKVNKLSNRQEKRIKKKILIRRLLSDPIHNSPNYHDENCNEADSAENYY